MKMAPAAFFDPSNSVANSFARDSYPIRAVSSVDWRRRRTLSSESLSLGLEGAFLYQNADAVAAFRCGCDFFSFSNLCGAT